MSPGRSGCSARRPTSLQTIRRAVVDELALGCSVGVAPNKFLAKLASVEAKPHATPAGIEPGDGVVVVSPGAEREFLDPLPVERFWGVGPVTLDKLHRIGIRRVADFATVGEPALTGALGAGQAHHLLELSVGADDRPVEPEREAKSISHEETYAANLTTPERTAHEPRPPRRRRRCPDAQGRRRGANDGGEGALRRWIPHDHPVDDQS